jgi:hypothetical protein
MMLGIGVLLRDWFSSSKFLVMFELCVNYSFPK